MPHAITQFQPTPNPHAVKCLLSPRLADPPRSYRSAADVGNDPVARALFAVPGVVGLLLSGDWMTVSKAPEAQWNVVKKGVEAALARL